MGKVYYKSLKYAVLLLIMAMLLTGCGGLNRTDTLAKRSREEDSTEDSQDTDLNKDSVAGDSRTEDTRIGGNSENILNKESIISEVNSEQEQPESYSWNEMTISIPSSWKGKYTIVENNRGFILYQTACYNKQEGWGELCNFNRSSEYATLPNVGTIYAYTDDTVYYSELTDSGCLYGSGETNMIDEYEAMAKDVEFIQNSLKIDVKNIHYDPDEYVIYNSDKWNISDFPYQTLDINQLWIAKNEIYARYGRKFTDEFLQSYFNNCSWYSPSIEPEEFDENILNDTEKENLKIIIDLEEDYEVKHPYPKKYEIGKTFEEDLNADGTKEKINFTFEQINEDGGYTGLLTIDGKTYDLVKDYDAYFLNPNQEGIYVTDITDDEPGLEIAVMVYGPSDYPVTEFYTYTDSLNAIGEIDGFPFKEYMGISGFEQPGGVTGVIRADIINTCYVYGRWWYDKKTGKWSYVKI